MRNQTYLTLLCLVFCTALFSQTQFIGPSGGDWSEPSNWNNGLPASGNDALIGGGSTVSINNDLEVNFLLQNFGTLVVKAAMDNNGTILNGGTMEYLSSAAFENNGVAQNNGNLVFFSQSIFRNHPGAAFTNSGTFSVETLLENEGLFTNNGSLNAPAGTLQTEGTFDNNQQLTTQSLTVLPGSTFNNNFGANLIATDSGTGIQVQGQFNNFGNILNEGMLVVTSILFNAGTIESPGNIEIAAGAQLNNTGTLENKGDLANLGTLVNSFLLINSGFLNNLGMIELNDTWKNLQGGSVMLQSGSSLNMNFGSRIENAGNFENKGDINSFGNIVNQANGQFLNAGDFRNNSGSLFDNDGNLVNQGVIFAVDVFRNDGVFVNENKLEINSGSEFVNAKDLLNIEGGKITVRQDFFNLAGATFTNEGVFTLEVRAATAGEWQNTGLMDIRGDLTILSGGYLDNAGNLEQIAGNILNEGVLKNTGTLLSDECSTVHNKNEIQNDGNFLLEAILFQRGLFSGNPVTLDGGYIHTSADAEAPSLCLNGSFGANIDGDVKVYASELIAFANFDSCANIIYLADGESKPVFSCSDVGSIIEVDVVLRTRLNDSLTCTAEVTPVDLLEPQFTTPCPDDIEITTIEEEVLVNWTPPAAVDNCTETVLTSNYEPGDLFFPGNTSVIYKAVDAYGNQNNCGFNVVVKGLTNCTQNTCPADQAKKVDFHSVKLAWEAAPNAQIYDVYIGTDNPPVTLVSPGVPATSVVLMDLLPETVYYWYVIPRNVNGSASGCASNVSVFETAPACDNVTHAGSLGPDQVLCDGSLPEPILSMTDAVGGSGDIEYIWQKTGSDPLNGAVTWQLIPGAGDKTYNPGPLSADSWFRRGVRREGCDDYLFTDPVKIGLVASVIPEVVISQPSCDQFFGIAIITNLPVGWYSYINQDNPATGKVVYTDLAPGTYSLTIGKDGCNTTVFFEIESFYSPPVAKCRDLTKVLIDGSLTIGVEELNDGSEVACGSPQFLVNFEEELTFDCSQTGVHTVLLLVTDQFGGASACEASITVQDATAPEIICHSYEISLDGSGKGSIVPEDVFESGSDNCGSFVLTGVEPHAFSCADLGIREVVLSAEDAHGNEGKCIAEVTVSDHLAPEVTCRDVTVWLDENCLAFVSPEEVFSGGTDNCGDIELVSVTPSVFECADAGTRPVVLHVRDAQGNDASCLSIVEVRLDENQETAYTLLAGDEIHVHRNTIFGNAGVWKHDKEAKIHAHSAIHGNLRSPREDISSDSELNGIFTPEAAPEPGPFIFYSERSGAYSQMDPVEVKVPDNYPGIYLLEGKWFDKIEIGKNATARFSEAGEILVKELKLKDADQGFRTALQFSGNTDLVMYKRLEIGKRSDLNWDGDACVRIFVEDDNVIVKENAKVQASIDVRSKEIKVEKSKELEPVEMVGRFIAKKIDADDHVEWYWQVCSSALIPPAAGLAAPDDELELVAGAVSTGVRIEWVTNTEHKNLRFVLERSMDGIHFESIASVNARGESIPYALYRNMDEQPNAGNNFYRVRAEFQDGGFMVSEIRRVFCPFTGVDVDVYPNPANSHISVYWADFTGLPAQVWIFNGQGRGVAGFSYTALPGEPLRLDVSRLPEGLYYLTINVDGYRERSKKFVIVH